MSAVDLSKFKGLTTTQKQNVAKDIFNDGITDDKTLTNRINAFVNADGLCEHKLNKLKASMAKLGY